MKDNINKLLSLSIKATIVSVFCFLYILLTTYVLGGVGFVVALLISTIAALIALGATIKLLIQGIDRTAMLILLFFLNAISLVIYAVMIFYTFFLVPVGVNEMMN